MTKLLISPALNPMSQATDANEVAFEAVRRKFESLCASLLPGLLCSLIRSKPGGKAADGLLIRFRWLAATCGEASAEASWSTGLEQLSGMTTAGGLCWMCLMSVLQLCSSVSTPPVVQDVCTSARRGQQD